MISSGAEKLDDKKIQLNMPREIEPLFTRINAVCDSLLAAHSAGKGSPNEVVGNEREIFLRKYLEAAYPRVFRFSSGFVIDKMGRKSGQLDIIAEKLYSIGFPAHSDSDERLCLAEMVSAIISVKSNLFSQWSQIEKEIKQLNPIQSKSAGWLVVNDFGGRIPFY